MIDIDWTPGRKKLRDFGLLLALVCAVWAVQSAWRSGSFHADTPIGWNAEWRTPVTLVLAGLVATAIAVTAPQVLRPLFVGWMLVAFPVAWVVSNLLLALTYYILFAGIGAVFKLIGRDELHRSFDPQAKTYWRERTTGHGPSRYLKQF